MIKTIVDSVKNEGITSLWHGLSATLLRQFTYSVTRFAIYEDMKSRLTPEGKKAPETGGLVIAAATAGAVAGVAGNPAELILVSLTSIDHTRCFGRLDYSSYF